jgi:hypothetical protein
MNPGSNSLGNITTTGLSGGTTGSLEFYNPVYSVTYPPSPELLALVTRIETIEDVLLRVRDEIATLTTVLHELLLEMRKVAR